jgi:hypothetical protein
MAKPTGGLAIIAGLAPKKHGDMAEAGESEGPEEDSSESGPDDAYEAELDEAAMDLMHAVKAGDKEMVKMALHRAVKACMDDEQS